MTYNLVKPPRGWPIRKVLHFGGYFFEFDGLIRDLNELPAQQQLTTACEG
jgi:hypothetical protein